VLIRSRLASSLGELAGVRIAGETDTAKDAIEAILRDRPDAVVLDLQLAAGSGIDVLRRVHAKAPEIVFIVLTQNAGQQYRRAALEAGARHFLDKSSDFDKVGPILTEMQRSRNHHTYTLTKE